MSYVADMAEAEQWLADWHSKITDRAERTRELAARISGIKASAESRGGDVRVTVDSAGTPVDIALAPAVENWPARRIAAEIMATMRQAQAELTGRVEQAAADTVAMNGDAFGLLVGFVGGWFQEQEADLALTYRDAVNGLRGDAVNLMTSADDYENADRSSATQVTAAAPRKGPELPL